MFLEMVNELRLKRTHPAESRITMEFRHYTQNDTQAIVSLFTYVFAKSEGEAEGALIGQLARDLIDKTNTHDLHGFVAVDDGQIIGSIFFSRLVFESGIEAFILAPVAVHSDHQGRGIGQALINHGLGQLKARGVSVAITYGDPGFYRKVGFHPISHETIKPPYELSQPEGWLGQSLSDDSIETLAGICSCVEAFRNPVYW
jgi:predicted N-acetyltransferase YhbS